MTALSFVALPQTPGVFTAEQASIGAGVYAQNCAACHGLNPTRKPGPPLAGVYGRRAGSVAAFHYSAALKGAALTWDTATLDRWLSGPPAFIPGVNMQAQVDSEEDRQDLIAYLRILSAPAAGQSGAASGSRGLPSQPRYPAAARASIPDSSAWTREALLALPRPIPPCGGVRPEAVATFAVAAAAGPGVYCRMLRRRQTEDRRDAT